MFDGRFIVYWLFGSGIAICLVFLFSPLKRLEEEKKGKYAWWGFFSLIVAGLILELLPLTREVVRGKELIFKVDSFVQPRAGRIWYADLEKGGTAPLLPEMVEKAESFRQDRIPVLVVTKQNMLTGSMWYRIEFEEN